MKKILLDTNAYSALLGGSKVVLDILGEAEVVYLSIFVLGELYAAFEGGSRRKENLNLLKRFLLKPTVKMLHATPNTAEIFGHIKHQLKKQGTPIPINDVWIAAHTVESGSYLISYDRDFRKVPGLLWVEMES